MNKSSIQPKRPSKVEIVILWHWAIVVSHCLGCLKHYWQFEVLVRGGLFGWAIWAAKTVIAFSQDQDAALLSMRRVHGWPWNSRQPALRSLPPDAGNGGGWRAY